MQRARKSPSQHGEELGGQRFPRKKTVKNGKNEYKGTGLVNRLGDLTSYYGIPLCVKQAVLNWSLTVVWGVWK